MNRQDLLVGVLVAALCTLLLIKHRWFLEKTTKGQWLSAWLGSARASVVLRVLAVCGIVFGLLLAGGIIRPVHWQANPGRVDAVVPFVPQSFSFLHLTAVWQA